MRCPIRQRRLTPTLPFFQYFHTVLQHLHAFYAMSFPTSVKSIRNPSQTQTIQSLLLKYPCSLMCEQMLFNTLNAR